MNTEVYSWRVSADLKADLERAAKDRKVPISGILDQAAREWLSKSNSELTNEEEQMRLRNAAMLCFGAFDGGEPLRAENARIWVRNRLRKRNAG